MVSDMDAMFPCIFTVYDVRMRIAIPCMVPRGYLMGPPLKISRFLGVVLSGGKSVKEELKCNFNCQGRPRLNNKMTASGISEIS